MPAPSRGNVVFYTDCRPPLTAGTYRLEVSQTLAKDAQRVDAGSANPLPGPTSHRIEISGPRFTMDPGELHAVYPPSNSRGSYASHLPLAVLRRRTLPWERTIDGTQAGAVADSPPWLALLLFEEQEVTLLDPPSCTVGFVVNDQAASTIAKIEVPGLPASGADRIAILGQPCLGVEVAYATFKGVAPMRSELGLLTHVRQVNTEDKELLGLDEDGWFAIVVGNRVPESGKSYLACLVSLEGCAPFLPTDAEAAAFTAADYDAELKARLSALTAGARPTIVGIPMATVTPLAAPVSRPTVVDAPLAPLPIAGPIGFPFPPIIVRPPVPPAPTNLTAAAISHTRIDIRWGDASADEAAFHIERCQGAGCTAFAQIAMVGANVTSYSDPGLSASTSYSYRVRARNLGGYSSYSNVAALTTPPPPIERIRLVTLARWRFTCQGGGDFETLMRELPGKGGVAMLGGTGRAVLDTGHVPLRHTMRAGEETTSWYRGPLVPTVIARETGGPYHTADQARRVDAQTGMENVAYAAAFEIGRLLALSDPAFALELLRWRRRGYRTRYFRVVKSAVENRVTFLFDKLERLAHIPFVKRTLDLVGQGIRTKNWVGPLTDPTGLARVRTTMPGLNAKTVVVATGLSSATVSAIFKAPIEGTSGILDSAGVRSDLPGGAVLLDFDALTVGAPAELGHLGLARREVINTTKPGGF